MNYFNVMLCVTTENFTTGYIRESNEMSINWNTELWKSLFKITIIVSKLWKLTNSIPLLIPTWYTIFI